MNKPDARAVAWVAAWEQLQAAHKIYKDHPDDVSVGVIVDRMHRGAGILAQLASVEATVGEDADEIIRERDQDRRQSKAKMDAFIADICNARDVT